MKPFSIIAILLLVVPFAFCFDLWGGSNAQPEIQLDEKFEKRKQPTHSFKSPFYMIRGSISFWQQFGDTVITNDYIRLTPAEKSRSGSIWNTKPVSFKNWEITTSFKVGSSSALGADGFAIWYVKESKRAGNVFGHQDKWNGLGILFDTFDNDGSNDNPSITVFNNDGSWSFDSGSDGKHQALGSCRIYYRNYETQVRIVYAEGTLQVLTKLQSQAEWSVCTTVLVPLPEGNYFGLTAATGGLADNHDIYRFEVNQLVPKADTNDEQEAKYERQADVFDDGQFFRNREIPTPEDQKENTDDEEEVTVDKKEAEKTEEKKEEKKEEVPVKPGKKPDVKFKIPNPITPPPNPVAAGEIPTVLGALSRDVAALAKSQEALQTSLLSIQNSVETYTKALEKDTQRLDSISTQHQKFAEAFESFTKQLPTREDLKTINVDGSDFSRELSNIRTQLDDMKKTVEIKSQSAVTTQQLEGLSRIINEIKGKVDTTRQQQAKMEQSIHQNQQQLSSTIESSSSLGFWVYFIIVQVVFGVSFMWWKKYRDESSKKFL